MALRRRGSQSEGMNVWPGYVDALSTLLMVIIFVLLVFVLAQAFLSVALSGRDRQLDRLTRQMAEISDMLSLERNRTAELQASVASLNKDLTAANSHSDALNQQLAALTRTQAQLTAERDRLKQDRDQLTARLADADLQARSAAARNQALQQQLAAIAQRGDTTSEAAAAAAAQAQANASEAAANLARYNAAAAELAATRQQLADMKAQAAALDQTVKADKATIDAKLSDLAKLDEELRTTTALRDALERQAQDAAVRATTEAERRAAVEAQLAEETRIGDSAKAQIALLNQQLDQLRQQMASLSAALDASEASGKDKDAQIANLGSRLNAALAQKVEELQRYRSEFFGKLREVLANRPGISIVGDRFVFQSEVLFPVGSADLSPQGIDQIDQLATTLTSIAAEIPKDVNWLLRVDGHADKQPTTGKYASNWELSAARAITVVKLLVEDGIPADRLAATAFGDHQPIDPADTPEAYAKNRRIELRLTDR
jgi:chemotaxis protein MotB